MFLTKRGVFMISEIENARSNKKQYLEAFENLHHVFFFVLSQNKILTGTGSNSPSLGRAPPSIPVCLQSYRLLWKLAGILNT